MTTQFGGSHLDALDVDDTTNHDHLRSWLSFQRSPKLPKMLIKSGEEASPDGSADGISNGFDPPEDGISNGFDPPEDGRPGISNGLDEDVADGAADGAAEADGKVGEDPPPVEVPALDTMN